MRVYKPGFTRPLPEGAKVFTRKGKKFAKFRDTKGHAAEAQLTKKGDRIRGKTEHWHIEFEDGQQIRRHLKAFTDERVTQRLADRIQQLLNYKATGFSLDAELQKFIENIPHRIRDELIRFGLLDAERTVAGKTLAELVGAFEKYLSAKERDPQHIKGTISSIKHLFAGCGFKFWSDINADSLKARLDESRDGGNGISKRTYNRYLKAAKHFCRWQARQLRTTSPIDFVEGLENEGTDRRHERRAATPDEIRRLLERTAAGPERFRMSGHERALLYRFAVETGFRAGEIRTLTKGCIDFDNLTVTVKAGYSKHRREDVQAIRPELAALLKEHCKGKLPAAIMFGGKLDRTAEMLKLDLKAAGIPYILDGKVFDFHALRHTFVTSLRSVSSRTAQALARHQSSEMTDRYTHIGLTDERAALDALPDYGAPSEKQKAKTGTDDNDAKLLSGYFSGEQQQQKRTITDRQNPDAAQKTPSGASGGGAGGTRSLLVSGVRHREVSLYRREVFPPNSVYLL